MPEARLPELAGYPVLTKSGIIVGFAETNEEVVETMRDLREHGVDVVTIGQVHPAVDRRVLRGAPLRLRLLRPAGALVLPR